MRIDDEKGNGHQSMAGEAPSSTLDVALKYIEAGINVTPVLSPKAGREGAGKAAYVPEWQKKRLSTDQFKKEFRKGSNIGVVTGRSSKLVCVDLDGRVGVAWFYENEERLGHCLIERRGTDGGIHLYFRYPENHGGTEGILPSRLRLFPGVDFLADGGKQVVTWPSVHRSGDAYAFDHGLSLLDLEAEADQPPEWLLDEVFAAAGGNAQKQTGAPPQLKGDFQGDVERCKEALLNHPPAIQGEAGDETTYRAALLCKDYGLSVFTAIGLLSEVYNPRCRPPWSQEDLKAKVRNAYRYSKSPGGQKSSAPEVMFPEGQGTPAPEGQGTPAPKYSTKHPVVSAKLFLARYSGEYLCANDQLFGYDRSLRCWEILSDTTLRSRVLADVEKLCPEVHGKMKTSQLNDITAMVKRLLEGAGGQREPRPDTWLDGRQGNFLSCGNGILDIETGVLLDHGPQWFSFTTLPYEYNQEAECPEFEKFLRDIWDNDQELIEGLRRWMGYVLLSTNALQKFAVFKGKSRGGKGTLTTVIENLIGEENCAACSVMGFGGDFGLQPVLGKRLAVFADADKYNPERVYGTTERIKKITGNDRLDVNRKNALALSLRLPVKIILVCNDIPPFCNDESALTNRMVVFPFDKTFLGKEDHTLSERLLRELPGILNWALRGARAILRGEKLLQSTRGREALEDIEATLNSTKGFIREMVDTSGQLYRHARVSNKAIWEAYREWCRDSNRAQKSKQRFINDLNAYLPSSVRRYKSGGERGYEGLQLRSPDSAFGDVDQDPEGPNF